MRSIWRVIVPSEALLLTAIARVSVLSCTYKQHQRSSIRRQPSPGIATRRDGRLAIIFRSSGAAADPEQGKLLSIRETRITYKDVYFPTRDTQGDKQEFTQAQYHDHTVPGHLASRAIWTDFYLDPQSYLLQVWIQSGLRLGLVAGLVGGITCSHLALRRTWFLHASVATVSFWELASDLRDWRKNLSRLRVANWSRARAHCCFHPLLDSAQVRTHRVDLLRVNLY